MKKNTASQIVGAQLNSKTDGSAVTTGTTTVYVTGDGGTQAAGSVGSGACTHEGQGFWTYAPAQAETNYDHVAFTFVNASAVAATVQIYPSFPQTGDNFVRLGAPAGASVSADVAAIKGETATILSDTNDIQTRIPASLVSGRIDASVGAMAAAVVTAAAIATDAIDADAIAADAVTEIQSGLSTLNAAGIRTAVGLASANLDTQLAAIDSVTDKVDTTLTSTGSPGQFVFTADALALAPAGTGASATAIADEVQTRTIAAVTTVNGLAANSVTAAALAADAVAEIQSGLATATNVTAAWTTALTEAYAADGSTMTPAQALYMIWSLLAERSIASTTLTAKKLDGSTTAMTFTLDSATTPTSQTRAT